MLELRPFTGHVVAAERARQVVAPPYDALEPTARAALAAADPDSYLGALPSGAAGDAGQREAALARCRTHLEQLFAAGRFRALPGPTIGVLTLTVGADRAVAVVGDVPVPAFAALEGGPARPFDDGDGLVRPHEHVREDRVAALSRYLEVVGVASSPVALTQRPSAAVTAATDAVTVTPPDLAYRADDGVDVALWCVTDPATCRSLTDAVGSAGPAFLADGHHRSAAAIRYASSVGASVDEPAGRVLCAVLPSDHLRVHPFHRRLDGVLPRHDGAAAVDALLDRVRSCGAAVAALVGPQLPSGEHRVTLTAGGRWWELDVTPLVRDDDPVEALDVRVVERDLAPLLTGGGRDHPAPTPVPAPLGLAALVAPGAIGLALHPPGVDTVLAVATAGRSVPAKTTYVAPKLRSGLVVTPRSRSARSSRL